MTLNATRFENGFSEKNFFRGKWVILGLKMTRPYNFGYAPRIFFKFCTMKGAKRYMELILIVFLKKVLFGENVPFWYENGTSS